MKCKNGSVTLRQRKRENGRISLYLDINIKGKRTCTQLDTLEKPTNKQIKELNKMKIAQAKLVESKTLLEIQNGTYQNQSSTFGEMRVIDYLNNYIEFELKNRSESTKRTYVVMKSHLVSSGLQDERLQDIDMKFGKRFIEHMKKSNIKNTSINIYISKLKTILNFAVKEDILTKNRLKGLRLEDDSEEISFLTIEELKAMLGIIPDNDTCRAFAFSCFTGLRFSDVKKLRWEDVSEFGGMVRLTFTQKKTKSKEYLDISDQAVKFMGERKNDSDFVFSGMIISNSHITRKITKWANRAGINKRVHFHMARHTFGTMMLQFGTDLYTVSKLLGHKDISTTQIYAKVIDEKKRDAVKRIPNIFEKKSDTD